MLSSLRAAARSLLRAPGTTLSAVVCLALALGAATAISSAIDRALLEPPPFRDPQRLVTVYRTTPHFDTGPHAAASFVDLAARARQVEIAALATSTAMLEATGEPMQVATLRVSGNLFGVLGVAALRGRAIAAADDAVDRPIVVMISEELWRSRLGADPAAVGRALRLNGEPVVVAGVAPAGLTVPIGSQLLRADVWEPLRFGAEDRADRGSNYLRVVGRLAPGATVAAASDELAGLFAGIVTEHPELRGEAVRAVSLPQEATRALRAPLLLLGAAVLGVLLIAAGNVASLLLARGVERRREVAIRAALGGGAWSIVRPLALESLLLALAGFAGGVGLGLLGIKTIGALAAQSLPQLAGLGLNPRLLLLALALALGVALICGALPAWRTLAVQPQESLGSGRGGGTGRRQRRALSALVVGEVALSLVLLLGAGLVLRGFLRLAASDPGFDPEGLLTLKVTVLPPGSAASGAATVERFLEPALAALRTLPEIEQAGAISLLPYENWGYNFNIRYEGQPADDRTQRPLAETRVVTPELFAVTGQRLLAGRTLLTSDDARPGSAPVVVVNRALAERDFPHGDALGKRFYNGDGEASLTTIVGVVSDIRNGGPFRPPQPEVYVPYRQSGAATSFSLLVRARAGSDPGQVLVAARAAIHRVDPTAAVHHARPMAEVIAGSLGRPRFYFALLAVFAGVALLLAVAGLFGVLSYSVARRSRELGIRGALGSTPARTLRLVAGQGMRLVLAGLGLGLAGGALATRALASLLYGVSPLDAPTWAGVCALFLVAGLAAIVVPALRAMRADPMRALSAD